MELLLPIRYGIEVKKFIAFTFQYGATVTLILIAAIYVFGIIYIPIWSYCYERMRVEEVVSNYDLHSNMELLLPF